MRASFLVLLLAACGERSAAPVVVPVASASAAPMQSSGVPTPPSEPSPKVERLSYEQALLRYNESEPRASEPVVELTNAQLSAPLHDASHLERCGAPSDMRVTVRLAVKAGRAVGVTVSTSPAAPGIRSCIEDWVWSLAWPSSRKLDTFTTQF